MVDHQARIRALRALGAEGSGATEPERKLANERADALEAKHGSSQFSNSSSWTTDTTVTSRDGQTYNDAYWQRVHRTQKTPTPEQTAKWWAMLNDLLQRQYAWNPPPGPDPDDLIDEQFKYDEDEDYGYDLFEGDDYDA